MKDINVGEDWDREVAEEEVNRLRKMEPGPMLTREEFLVWRAPRKVSQQAVRLDNPLWHWLVRTRWDAYNANEIYAGPSSCDAGPMWTFERFGQSETLLPDGKVIHIGGEHEDYYDPDFFIYNDVVVIGADGDIAIYGYPVEDFPPTDFHSATLVGNTIFIIGRLGYPDQRQVGTTAVYRLALDSMRISPVATSGEAPGWLYQHFAMLADDGHSIVVSGGERWFGNDCVASENIDTWSLNTLTGEWQCLNRRNWQRWMIRRIDRKRSRLWDVRQALWQRDHAHMGFDSYWKYGDEPDFVALDMLYRLDDDSPPPKEGPDFNVFTNVIDGLTIRFKEGQFRIEAIVEGQLAGERLAAIQSRTLALIEQLEASACLIETMERGDAPA